MSILIINYHRTTADLDGASTHVLSDTEFDAQLELIRTTGLSVVESVELCNPPDGKAVHKIGITFDDGFQSDLRNARKLASLGWSATFFISTANIGTLGYLDAADIHELRDLGMSIGSHSHEHVRLTAMAPREAEANIRRSKDVLEALLGVAVDRFAFPGGTYSSEVTKLVRLTGFRYAFGTRWGVNHLINSIDEEVIRRNNIIHGMPPPDFMNLISLRKYWRRELKYGLRTAAFRLLPERAYGLFRSLFVRT